MHSNVSPSILYYCSLYGAWIGTEWHWVTPAAHDSILLCPTEHHSCFSSLLSPLAILPSKTQSIKNGGRGIQCLFQLQYYDLFVTMKQRNEEQIWESPCTYVMVQVGGLALVGAVYNHRRKIKNIWVKNESTVKWKFGGEIT